MEEEHPEGWTKPKQSFRLKKSIGRPRPALGSSNSNNRTLPLVPSQPVKRRNSYDKDDVENRVNGGLAKKQRIRDIFSPSSSFLQNKTLPASLQRRVSESNQSCDSRGKTIKSPISIDRRYLSNIF